MLPAALTRFAIILLMLGGAWLNASAADASNPSSSHRHSNWVTPPVPGKLLVQHRIASRLAGTEVSYHLLTPPEYWKADARRYPVLYWLHGSDGGLGGLRPLAQSFDAAMRADTLPPLIVVFPNGKPKSLWIDARDGHSPVESVFIEEIIPDVDRRYRTIADRTGRLLEGFSMGGYGAARIGLTHSELFSAISLLAAGPLQPRLSAAEGPALKSEDRARALREVFGDDPDYFRAVSPWALAEDYAREGRQPPLIIRQVIGELDQSLPANQAFSDHLEGLGIPHQFHRVPGVGHRALKLLEGLGEANWAFYRRVFPGAD